jgi:hypothetical protein
LFDVFVVDELPAPLLEELLAGAAEGVAGGDAAGADGDPAAVSFFSFDSAGAFSPSDGGFSLFE